MTGKRVRVWDTERTVLPHRQPCPNDAGAIEEKAQFLSRSAVGEQKFAAKSDIMAPEASPLAIEVRRCGSRHVGARHPEAMQRLAMRGR
jgi:hypothetical protein